MTALSETSEIIVTCPFCSKTRTLTVNTEALIKWKSGMLIQEAFPMLRASEREAIMTGICDPCWKDMWSDDPDPDPDDPIMVDPVPDDPDPGVFRTADLDLARDIARGK